MSSLSGKIIKSEFFKLVTYYIGNSGKRYAIIAGKTVFGTNAVIMPVKATAEHICTLYRFYHVIQR